METHFEKDCEELASVKEKQTMRFDTELGVAFAAVGILPSAAQH